MTNTLQPVDSTWLQQCVETNGVTLHVVDAGPRDGPLVVMLHGFPEFWGAWKQYVGPLAAAGYRVIVPDQRGYNLSARPAGAKAYTADILAADVVGLIDAAGRQRAALIGHDFGGFVGWWTAALHPSRVERLVVLNAPHPRAMVASLLSNPLQIAKSWYIFVLQIPWLPERIVSVNSFAVLRSIIRWTGEHGSFSAADEASYIDAWSKPGSLTAMINWYRALFRRVQNTLHLPRITVPVLLIWGKHDRYLSRSLAEASIEYCDDGRLEWVGATHWLHHEKPDVVHGLIARFLAGSAPPGVKAAVGQRLGHSAGG